MVYGEINQGGMTKIFNSLARFADFGAQSVFGRGLRYRQGADPRCSRVWSVQSDESMDPCHPCVHVRLGYT